MLFLKEHAQYFRSKCFGTRLSASRHLERSSTRTRLRFLIVVMHTLASPHNLLYYLGMPCLPAYILLWNLILLCGDAFTCV